MNSYNCTFLFDLLCEGTPSKRWHSAVVTALLLSLDNKSRGETSLLTMCQSEVNKKHWNLNSSLITFVVNEGSSEAKFSLLTSSLRHYLSATQFRNVFDSSFRAFKRDDEHLVVLSDILHGFLKDPAYRRHASWFESHIKYFLEHNNINIQKFAVISAACLRTPDERVFGKIINGLKSHNFEMRLNSVNALQLFLDGYDKIPSRVTRIFCRLNLPYALKNLRSRDGRLVSNVDEVSRILSGGQGSSKCL